MGWNAEKEHRLDLLWRMGTSVFALFELLHEKGIISPEEIKDIVKRKMDETAKSMREDMTKNNPSDLNLHNTFGQKDGGKWN